MGEVYKARDTRLNRDVALKILPATAAGDADRLRRFAQEARAAAALNHPNILVVHDVGTESGVPFVVSELLEGESLRARLASGPVPPRKAMEYAAQMARGLAAAHDRGIVHRDLKPDNVFVTSDGRVKILDFGLAKLTAAAGAPPSPHTAAPTIESATTPGLVLGTIGYMSPEQVRGLAADHRSDIFSFGAILYEMLSGRRAFAGATPADTMSAILVADPPDAPALRAAPPLDRLARRCLEKNPDERFQSAHDLAFDVEGLSTASFTVEEAAVQAPSAARHRRTRRAAILLAAGAVAGGLMMLALMTAMRPAPATARFRQVTFRRGAISGARFTPDGETIVYSAAWEGRSDELFTARAGAVGERPLGIAGQVLAASATGEVALLRDARAVTNWMQTGTLARVPLAGGAPHDILRDVGGADWSPDGRELAVTRMMKAPRTWRLEYPIGTVLLETDRWIDRPRISADGNRVILFEHPVSGDNRGRVLMVGRDRKTTYLTGEYVGLAGIAWSPRGDEAWFSAADAGTQMQLYAVRPGAAARPIAGMPGSLVLEDVRSSGRILVQSQTLKTRMFVKTPADAEERDISWFDYGILRDMSADGSMILFDEQGEGGGPGYSVFVRHTDGRPAMRLGEGFAGRLSPDLQWATTGSASNPARNGFSIVPIGPGETRRVTLPLQNVGVGTVRWFPDGKRLMVVGNEPGRPRRTFELEIDGMKLRPLTPEGVIGTHVSPDGRRLIVTTADGGTAIAGPDGTPQEIRGLTPQDTVVRWAGDGRSISVFSAAQSEWKRTFARLDFTSGRRQPIATIAPADAAGIRSISSPQISADGRSYAYRFIQSLSDLYVGEGLR